MNNGRQTTNNGNKITVFIDTSVLDFMSNDDGTIGRQIRSSLLAIQETGKVNFVFTEDRTLFGEGSEDQHVEDLKSNLGEKFVEQAGAEIAYYEGADEQENLINIKGGEDWGKVCYVSGDESIIRDVGRQSKKCRENFSRVSSIGGLADVIRRISEAITTTTTQNISLLNMMLSERLNRDKAKAHTPFNTNSNSSSISASTTTLSRSASRTTTTTTTSSSSSTTTKPVKPAEQTKSTEATEPSKRIFIDTSVFDFSVDPATKEKIRNNIEYLLSKKTNEVEVVFTHNVAYSGGTLSTKASEDIIGNIVNALSLDMTVSATYGWKLVTYCYNKSLPVGYNKSLPVDDRKGALDTYCRYEAKPNSIHYIATDLEQHASKYNNSEDDKRYKFHDIENAKSLADTLEQLATSLEKPAPAVQNSELPLTALPPDTSSAIRSQLSMAQNIYASPVLLSTSAQSYGTTSSVGSVADKPGKTIFIDTAFLGLSATPEVKKEIQKQMKNLLGNEKMRVMFLHTRKDLNETTVSVADKISQYLDLKNNDEDVAIAEKLGTNGIEIAMCDDATSPLKVLKEKSSEYCLAGNKKAELMYVQCTTQEGVQGYGGSRRIAKTARDFLVALNKLPQWFLVQASMPLEVTETQPYAQQPFTQTYFGGGYSQMVQPAVQPQQPTTTAIPNGGQYGNHPPLQQGQGYPTSNYCSTATTSTSSVSTATPMPTPTFTSTANYGSQVPFQPNNLPADAAAPVNANNVVIVEEENVIVVHGLPLQSSVSANPQRFFAQGAAAQGAVVINIPGEKGHSGRNIAMGQGFLQAIKTLSPQLVEEAKNVYTNIVVAREKLYDEIAKMVKEQSGKKCEKSEKFILKVAKVYFLDRAIARMNDADSPDYFKNIYVEIAAEAIPVKKGIKNLKYVWNNGGATPGGRMEVMERTNQETITSGLPLQTISTNGCNVLEGVASRTKNVLLSIRTFETNCRRELAPNELMDTKKMQCTLR